MTTVLAKALSVDSIVIHSLVSQCRRLWLRRRSGKQAVEYVGSSTAIPSDCETSESDGTRSGNAMVRDGM